MVDVIEQIQREKKDLISFRNEIEKDTAILAEKNRSITHRETEVNKKEAFILSEIERYNKQTIEIQKKKVQFELDIEKREGKLKKELELLEFNKGKEVGAVKIIEEVLREERKVNDEIRKHLEALCKTVVETIKDLEERTKYYNKLHLSIEKKQKDLESSRIKLEDERSKFISKEKEQDAKEFLQMNIKKRLSLWERALKREQDSLYKITRNVELKKLIEKKLLI